VVDDGSTIDIREVLAGVMPDPRIRLLHQAAAGASAARNHGIALSQGEYIALLDSDDICRPSRLRKQLRSMLLHNADFSLCRRLIKTGARLRDIDRTHADQDIWIESYQDFNAKRWPLSASLMMFRRQALDRPLFDESLPSANDLDALLGQLGRKPMLLVNEVLVIMDKSHKGTRLSDHYIAKLDSYEIVGHKSTQNHYGLSQNDIGAIMKKLERDQLYLLFLTHDLPSFRSAYRRLQRNPLSLQDRVMLTTMYLLSYSQLLTRAGIRMAEQTRRLGWIKM
jgi:glycosyltransferase involved in cell wall biosynthesis